MADRRDLPSTGDSVGQLNPVLSDYENVGKWVIQMQTIAPSPEKSILLVVTVRGS